MIGIKSERCREFFSYVILKRSGCTILSDKFSLLTILILGLGPILFILIYLKDLFFRGTPRENARVIRFEGPSEEREQYFVDAIRELPEGTTGHIVAGEANPDYWTANVCQALKDVYLNKGILHFMILGPVVLLDDKTGKSYIIELAKNNEIKLFVSPARQKDHFRATTNGKLYWEDPHYPGQRGGRTGHNFPSNRFEAKRYIRKFKKLRESAIPSLDPGNDFIQVNGETLRKLREKLKESKIEYNKCDVNVFRKILRTI